MRSIKPFKLLILSFGLVLSVANNAQAQLEVLACEPEWEALVKELGGERVNTRSATTAFQDPHYIEARPSLIAKARRADLLVCTGAELEIGWLPLLLRQSGNAKIQSDEPGYFLAAEQVGRIEIPTELDRNQGDIHASGNPHVHWDPNRLLTIAKALAERLKRLDSDHASDYERQFQHFAQRWQAAIKQWETKAKPLKGKKVVVHHKNWSYLLNWLGINGIGELEPKPGLPPTSGHLSNLLKRVRGSSPDYILITNFQNDSGANWLSGKLAIPVTVLPFTVGGNDQAKDLFSLYEDVIQRLLKNKTAS